MSEIKPVQVIVSLVSPGIYLMDIPELHRAWSTGISPKDILEFRGSMNDAILHYTETFLEKKLDVPFTVTMKETKHEPKSN